ncbi:MAG TPA: DUF6193 family natural product biosynthesis protein [Pseudonocardiaceae bacterium]|nr:DUF6193 family natural product biosynthesis protein [Pseudonocardiaceae bacterium]
MTETAGASLREVVQAEFDRTGRAWAVATVCNGRDTCRLDSAQRYVVVKKRRSYTGIKDHEFTVSAGTRGQWPATDFVAGITLEVADATEVMHAWQSGAPLAEILEQYPFMIAKQVFDEQQRRAAPAECRWQGYLHPHYGIFRRHMLPMMVAASRQPRLRALFPFTSMFNLCFKDPGDPSWPHHLPSIKLVGHDLDQYAVLEGSPGVELDRGDLESMITLLVTRVEGHFGPVEAD